MKKNKVVNTQEELNRRKKSRFRIMWLLVAIDFALVVYLVVELFIVFLK